MYLLHQEIFGPSAFCPLVADHQDGRVVTWGHPSYGGESRFLQEELKDVQEIQASAGWVHKQPLQICTFKRRVGGSVKGGWMMLMLDMLLRCWKRLSRTNR